MNSQKIQILGQICKRKELLEMATRKIKTLLIWLSGIKINSASICNSNFGRHNHIILYLLSFVFPTKL